MVLLPIKNRLSTANKQLLVSSINRVDLYEAICNIFLLCRMYEQCRLLCFAYLITLNNQNIICKNDIFSTGI